MSFKEISALLAQKWDSLLVFFIFIIFCITRYLMFGSHFTHYDDIFGPYLIQVISNYDQQYFISQVQKYGSSLGPDIQAFIISIFVENEILFSFIKRIIGAVSISLVSTFAPIQFIFTAMIIDFNLPYPDFIKMMRLPSLIFAFGSFWILILYSKLFERSIKKTLLVTGCTLLTVSWMSIIYSSQSENFILGLFATFLLFFIIQKIYYKELSFIYSLSLGFILSILCFSHYQVMFFLPGFYLGYLFAYNSQKFWPRLFSLIPAVIINLITVAIIYFVFLSTRLGVNPGVHWNAGLNNEFVWSPAYLENGFIGSLLNIINFFFINCLKVLYGIFGFRDAFDSISIFFALFLFIFSIIGIYKLGKTNKLRHLFIFILITIFVWLFLIFIQKLTFSPTRHSLALIPIVIILFSFGISEIFTKYKFSQNIKNTFLITFCFIHISFFLESYSKIYKQRTNPFLYDVDVLEIIKEFNVKKIAAYGHTGDLNFFPEINKKYDIKWSNKFPFTHVIRLKDRSFKENQDGAVMIICANSEICGKRTAEEFALKELDFVDYENNKFLEPLFTYEADSDVTNGFSNMAGSGTRRIFVKVLSDSNNL